MNDPARTMTLEEMAQEKAMVTVIVPTMDNPHMLNQMISSWLTHTEDSLTHRIIVVNNGRPGSCRAEHEKITVIEAGGNRGWEGGLKLGLAETISPFVMFANDDLHIVAGNREWLKQLSEVLLQGRDKKIAAVGPTSNFVMGHQHMQRGLDPGVYKVQLLIGFCVLLRRDALDEVGGVTEGLPGGDDFDLSIRLVQAGWTLALHAGVFVYHWGSATGARLHGAHWNSREMLRDTRNELIRRHKLRPYLATYVHPSSPERLVL